jgi:RNA polymerase sigma factor (sigma-70 family)
MINTEFQTKLVGQLSDLKAFSRRYVISTAESDDLVQETVIKALRFWNSFKEGTNFRGWLHVIMRNTYIDLYQAKKRARVQSISDSMPDEALTEYSTYNTAESDLILATVRGEVDKLSDDLSVPFVMYFEGYRYHEIASDLSIPIGTIKTRIHCARKLLKKNLASYGYYKAIA